MVDCKNCKNYGNRCIPAVNGECDAFVEVKVENVDHPKHYVKEGRKGGRRMKWGEVVSKYGSDVDIDELLSDLQDNEEWAGKNGNLELQDNLQNAIMVIAAMRHELSKCDERWISTKDRLPEGRDPVLLYHKYGMCIGFYSKIMNMWDIIGNPVMIGRNQIDYWKPLPEPPKKEDEQNG